MLIIFGRRVNRDLARLEKHFSGRYVSAWITQGQRSAMKPQRNARAGAPRHGTAEDYQATSEAIVGAVLQPQLRALIERLPLWRRPGYLIRRLHQIHNAMFLEECGEFEITPVQYGLLTTLSLHPDADQKALAQEVGLDRTNVADVLSRLKRRGLITRRRGTTDRRMMLTRLTEKGARLTLAMHEAMSRAQFRLLEPITAAERDAFVATLLRLVDANNHVGRAALGTAGPADRDAG